MKTPIQEALAKLEADQRQALGKALGPLDDAAARSERRVSNRQRVLTPRRQHESARLLMKRAWRQRTLSGYVYDEEAVPAVLAVASNRDEKEELRGFAIETLGMLGFASAVETLDQIAEETLLRSSTSGSPMPSARSAPAKAERPSKTDKGLPHRSWLGQSQRRGQGIAGTYRLVTACRRMEPVDHRVTVARPRLGGAPDQASPRAIGRPSFSVAQELLEVELGVA